MFRIISKLLFTFSLLFLSSSAIMACGSSCCQTDEKTSEEQSKSCCSKSEETEKKKSCCSTKEQTQDTEKSCCSEEGKECDGSCKKNGCVCTPTITYMLDTKAEFRFLLFKAKKVQNHSWGYALNTPKPVYYSIWQPPKIVV